MDIPDTVEKKMTIETKLLIGFVMVYAISAVVPGLVTFLIDTYFPVSIFSQAMVGFITFCVILILVAVLVGYLMKWITKPVRKLCHAAEQLVGGELNVDLEVESSAELQSISKSLHRMKSSLRIAHDWLGPADIRTEPESQKKFGIGLKEKVIIGMILFLLLNPMAASLSYFLFSESVLLSSVMALTFTVILLAVIANYLFLEIIKPLRQLAQNAERVSMGDFSETEPVKYRGDLGRLDRDFKLISQRVQRAMKELSLDG